MSDKHENKEKIISRNFALILVSRFSYCTVYLMLTATIAPYVIGTYGVSEGQAGIAVGLYITAALLSRLFVGKVMTYLSYMSLLRVSLVAFFATTLLYLVPMPYILFLATRVANGFFFGFMTNTVSSLSVFVIPNSRLGEGLGYMSLSTNLPSAVGPFLGLYLSSGGVFDSMFVASAILVTVSLVTGLLVNVKTPDQKSASEREQTSEAPKKKSSILYLAAIPICSIMLFSELFYTGTTSFISIYTDAMGTAAYVSWFFIAYSAVTIFTRPIAGKLLDTKGDFVVLVPAMIICGLGYLLLGSVPTGWAVVLSGVCLALGRGTILGVIQAMAVMGVPAESVGVATATFYLFADAGSGIGPAYAGSLASAVGGRDILFNLQCGAMLLLLVYYLVIRKHISKSKR